MKQTLLLFYSLLFGLHAYAANGDVFTAKTVKSAVENTEKEEFFIIASDSTLETESILTKNVGNLISKSGTCTFIDGDAISVTQTYYYMDVMPSSATSHPSIAFKIPDGTKGKYEIYLVTVPLWVSQFNFETEKRPYRFNANIYEKVNGQYPNGNGVRLVNPVDSTTKIFTTPIPLNEFTISDTTYLGEYMFNGNDAAIQIQSNISSKTTSDYSREMLITGFILKESIDPHTNLVEIDNIRYLLDEDLHLAQIRKNSYQGDIEIPASVDYMGKEYTVNSIGPRAFSGCSGLTSIVIPNSVTNIGPLAFSGCSTLTSVTLHCTEVGTWFSGLSSIKNAILGDEVSGIRSSAFKNCSGLTSIEIPNSITNIGTSAFEGCSSLASPLYNNTFFIYLPSVFQGAYTIPDGIETIVEGAFSGCDGLTSIEIPNSVTTIGSGVFFGCSSMTSVILHCPTVNTWFSGLTSIKEIILGEEVTNIIGGAFEGCSGLATITIPNSVANIGDNAFSGCSSLTSVTLHCPTVSSWFSGLTSIKEFILGDEVTSIGNFAFFGCNGLTSIEIPSSVTSIGEYAFMNCTGLISITIPDNIMDVGNMAFHGTAWYNSLPEGVVYLGHIVCGYKGKMPENTNLVLKEGSKCIAANAFRGNYASLVSITIPKSITHINENAFYGCSGLTSIEIPNSVISIGREAFRECSNLKTVSFEDGLDTLFLNGRFFFQNCPIDSVYLGRNINLDKDYNGNYIYSPFENIQTLRSVAVGSTVQEFGIGYDFSGTNLQAVHISDLAAWCNVSYWREESNPLYYAKHLYLNGEEVKNLVVPDGVLKIRRYALVNCSSLISVELPSSVSSIEREAFYGCGNLTSIEIPNSVTSIGLRVFEGCSSLTSIQIPNSVTSIGLRVFEGCSSLTFVAIPDGVTSIGESAFYNCSSLTSVQVPNSVTIIGDFAFAGCSSLTSVKIGNSVTSIGYEAFAGCSSLTYIYCYAENVPETGQMVFYQVPATATLHVLSTCVDEYKKTYPWSSFKNIVEIPNEIKYSENGIKYTLFYNSHQATVMPSGLSIYSGHVVIPETVIYEGEEYTVTAIENSAFYEIWGSLESVSLPKSITTIGEDAFKNCENLKLIVHGAEPPATESAIVVDSLEVPKGCTVAYARATGWNGTKHIYATEDGVEYYPVLTEVDSINCFMVNGEAVRDMEAEAGQPISLLLDSCLEDTAVLVMQGGIDITEQLLQGDTCTFEPSAKYSENVLEVCAYPTKEVTLAKSGTLISQIGAANVNDVYSLKLAGDINGTDIRSILRLQNLRLLDLGEANIVEGGLAYYDGYATTDSVVGRCFFKDLAKLKRVTFPTSVVSIQERAFEGCTSLRTLTIPEQMDVVDISAFNDCAQLTYLKVENGDEPLKFYCEHYDEDDDIWHNLHNSPLVALYMGRNIAYIEGYYTSTTPFTWHKETLRTVTIGKRVTEITGSFFYGCTGLKSVTIGSNVKTIGSYAFSECPNLTDIYSFNATPPEIQATTFDAVTEQQATLYVPVGSTDLYWLYPYWENFFDIKENPAAQIAAVRSDAPKVVTGIYTLDGRKCNTTDTSTLPHGIYIVDGKKLLVK